MDRRHRRRLRKFEIFNNRGSKPYSGKRRSRWTKYNIAGSQVYLHYSDCERAHKAFLRTQGDAEAHQALRITEPRNDQGLLEFDLYGYPWMAVNALARRRNKWIAAHVDCIDRILELFLQEEDDEGDEQGAEQGAVEENDEDDEDEENHEDEEEEECQEDEQNEEEEEYLPKVRLTFAFRMIMLNLGLFLKKKTLNNRKIRIVLDMFSLYTEFRKIQ